MSKLEKSGKFRPFRPCKMTFRAIQSNPALGRLISTILGKVHAKIDKNLLTSVWEKCLKSKKGTHLDLLTFQNYPWSDSTKSFLWYVVNVIPKKPHAKKEKKLQKRFWDWPFPPVSCRHPPPPTTTTPTTPTTTTDESAFEKLRCQMAPRS